uniref:Serine-threonine kinase receptor-associated protein n=1 Tax=Oryzias latipes TaxID=8090 RepID=A0A3P9IQU9_ORYLA
RAPFVRRLLPRARRFRRRLSRTTTNHGHEADPPHLFGSHPTRGGPGLQRNHAFRILPHQRLQGWQAHVAPRRHRRLDRNVSWSQRCCLGGHSEHGRHQSRHRRRRLHSEGVGLGQRRRGPVSGAQTHRQVCELHSGQQPPSDGGKRQAAAHFRPQQHRRRLWDRTSMEEVKTLTFNTSVSSMEYMADGEILVITYGKTIAFYNALSLELIKTAEAPAPINSASLHPEKDFFVAGGEDFKLYKFDYSTQEELESYKGHFGPVHCVRFSPDGELYASGSEDGTLRLWQTAVGKTYGLWKCVLPEDLGADNSEQMYGSTPEIKA